MFRTLSAAVLVSMPCAALGQDAAKPSPEAVVAAWKAAEAPVLSGHLQFTSRQQFVKAGEAYFSPDSKWIIFQAVATPAPGETASSVYAMFVAPVQFDANGDITGLGESRQISPALSANTCGWFHPTRKARVVYGSTMIPPTEQNKPGFQVGTNRYVWAFPSEMEVVTQAVLPIADSYGAAVKSDCGSDWLPQPLFSRKGYDAECSYSRDGRYLLYCHVDDKTNADGSPAKPDGNIWVMDTVSGKQTPLVEAPGYDGGPFFSPDGRSICYRSDRKGDDLLQLFVSDLKFDSDGMPSGVVNERQVTDNDAVNWAPFYHPSGRFLVYGTSEIGHSNYEVFAVEADKNLPAAELKRVRITHAPGADVLPVFSPDGRYMMWTSQRGPLAEGETKSSSQLWIAKFTPGALFGDAE